MSIKNTILICGYGVSGQAAARLAAEPGKTLVLADESHSPEMRRSAEQLCTTGAEVRFYPDWKEAVALPPCGTVIVSPGIRRGTALYRAAERALAPGGQWLGELEFALRRLNCPFAVTTGTNGKTTVTELTAALLTAHGVRAQSAGNIGAALSAAVSSAAQHKIEYLAVEASSFQLEEFAGFPACPAAILNLASDHLDRHGTLEEYARIKFKVFAADRPGEQRIMNSSLRPWLDKFLPGAPVTTFSAADHSADFTLNGSFVMFHERAIFDLKHGQLRGVHHAENLMAALGHLRAVKGDDALFRPETGAALAAFQTAPHRMEVFACRRGVAYIDDSKATNPHATNAAVRRFGAGCNLCLILGGLDKGMDFAELAESYPFVRRAFLVGECREALYRELAGKVDCHLSAAFETAVRDACAAARPGDCVMLSPAAASMDMFKNYAERGDKFQQLVRQWLKDTRNK